MATRRLGTDGADTLSAVDAGDTLAGGDGDDYYFVHSMLDVVEEVGQYYDFEQDLYLSGGIDTVSTDVLDRLRTYSIAQLYGVENLSCTGAVAAMLRGNDAHNVIKANAASSTSDTLACGPRVRCRAAAAIQPAVPPPTIRIERMGSGKRVSGRCWRRQSVGCARSLKPVRPGCRPSGGRFPGRGGANGEAPSATDSACSRSRLPPGK